MNRPVDLGGATRFHRATLSSEAPTLQTRARLLEREARRGRDLPRRSPTAGAYLIAGVELPFYLGNILGASKSAARYNSRKRSQLLERAIAITEPDPARTRERSAAARTP